MGNTYHKRMLSPFLFIMPDAVRNERKILG